MASYMEVFAKLACLPDGYHKDLTDEQVVAELADYHKLGVLL